MRRLLIGVLAALASASVAFAQEAERLDRHGEVAVHFLRSVRRRDRLGTAAENEF
jgi:hypothetical protein